MVFVHFILEVHTSRSFGGAEKKQQMEVKQHEQIRQSCSESVIAAQPQQPKSTNGIQVLENIIIQASNTTGKTVFLLT